MPVALFVGRNAPVIVERTVRVALLPVTVPTEFVTTTENTAALSAPVTLASD